MHVGLCRMCNIFSFCVSSLLMLFSRFAAEHGVGGRGGRNGGRGRGTGGRDGRCVLTAFCYFQVVFADSLVRGVPVDVPVDITVTVEFPLSLILPFMLPLVLPSLLILP